MNLSEKHLSAQETHKFQQDLKWFLDQCDNIITKIAKHEHENAENLRSAVLTMRDMGYTAEEAKDELTRFQAEYNADTSGCAQVNVHRRHRSAASSPKHGRINKHRLTGSQRFSRAFTLCLVVIPILFVVGTVAEIWFYYNPWGPAVSIVCYVKAILYIGVWYALLSTCMHTTIVKLLSVLFCFAGIGMVFAWEPVVLAWGSSMWGASSWSSFWLNTQWVYWGLLALTYLYAWCKLAHGPRHWIMKYGVG